MCVLDVLVDCLVLLCSSCIVRQMSKVSICFLGRLRILNLLMVAVLGECSMRQVMLGSVHQLAGWCLLCHLYDVEWV